MQTKKAKLIKDKKGNWKVEITTINRIAFGKNKKGAEEFLETWHSGN